MTRASWLAPSSSSRRAATPTPRPRSRRCRRAAATIASWWRCASPSATTISAGTGRPSPACSRTCRAPSGKPRRASSTCPRRARSAITPATWPRPARWPPISRPGAWTEETLNNLATHYIVTDDDATAGTVFADYLERFPQGKYGARAAWRLGWWKYRAGGLRGRRRDLRSGRGQLSALRLPSELAVLGRPRLREGQPDAARPTPASSWCAPTISTPTTDASPACTSAPRTRRARRSARSAAGGRRAPPAGPAAERGRDPAADPVRRVPARRGRDPLRAAALRAVAGARGDAGLAAPRARRVSSGDQRDEARLSAVHDAGRRSAAARSEAGDLPARLLAAHLAPRQRPRPRPVPDRGARRAGIDVRPRRPLGGQRLRPDADRPGDRQAPGALARHPQVLDRQAHRSRDQRQARDASTSRGWSTSSAARTSRWPATTPARTASSAGSPSAARCRRTSSSTTSRSPRRSST